MSDRRDFHPYILALRARGARHALTLAFLLLGGAFFRLQVLEHDRFAATGCSRNPIASGRCLFRRRAA